MKIVIMGWALTVVTLICVALAVTFWSECRSDSAIYTEFIRGTATSVGWRPVQIANAGSGRYFCRPRLYHLIGY